MAIALAAQIAAQVQTVVPPVVAGAKPVTVERIKVHGTALEGNLEGDAKFWGYPNRRSWMSCLYPT